MTIRQQNRAIELLRLAQGALNDEYIANGHEETMQHPTLKEHFRLQRTIERFLAKVKANEHTT